MIKLERLQAQLDATGLSANAASQVAGFGRDYVRDLLRGKVKDPSFSRLLRLAEVLQCSTEYLTGDADDVGSSPSILKVSQTVLIPVSMRLRPGFFETGSAEIKTPFDWNVGSIGLVQIFERLVYVERSPVVGLILEDDSLLHIVSTDGLREGNTVLCVLKHPSAELFAHAVFKVHILEPDYDDFIELTDGGRARARDQRSVNPMQSASGFISGQNDLGIQVIGRVAAIYRYMEDHIVQQLREKSRAGD